jgi:hypothetical protein
MKRLLNDIDYNLRINIIENEIIKVKDGIIFIYSDWAPYTYKFKLLLDSIKVDTPEIYIIDFENKICSDFLNKNSLIKKCEIGGWGEIFWIKNYELLCCLSKEFDDLKLAKCNTIAGYT